MTEDYSLLPHIESYRDFLCKDSPKTSRLHQILNEFFPIIIENEVEGTEDISNDDLLEVIKERAIDPKKIKKYQALSLYYKKYEVAGSGIEHEEDKALRSFDSLKSTVKVTFECEYKHIWRYEDEFIYEKPLSNELLVTKHVNIPEMNERGSFIIEGIERVPIAQLLPIRLNNQTDISTVASVPIAQLLPIRGLLIEDKKDRFEAVNGSEGFFADDTEHLKTKKILLVGDHLAMAVKKALRDMKRYLEMNFKNSKGKFDINRFSAYIPEIFNKRIREYFTGELCQILDQTNPLSEVSHKRKITSYGPGGIASEYRGFQRRDVHYSHYGRICPVETPESQRIGLTVHFASHAKVKENQILTPIRCPDGEIRYLTAEEEESLIIAPYSFNDAPPLYVRQGKREMFQYDGDAKTLHRDAYPEQFIGIGASLIPFIQHDDANRALMGAKNLKQALPLKHPEQPLVKTGYEGITAKISGRGIYAERAGKVKAIKDGVITIRHEDFSEKTYPLMSANPSITGTVIEQKPIVEVGDEVYEGQCLADGPAMKDGELALGVNLLVAYLPWYGYNFEDGIVISDRLVREDVLTSLHMKELIFEIEDDEIVTGVDIKIGKKGKRGNDLEDDALTGGIGEEGYIKTGQYIEHGDPLLIKYKIFKQKNDLNQDEKPVKVLGVNCLPRPIIVKADEDTYGTVVYSNRIRKGNKECIVIWLRYERKVTVGDKLMGRHGNKGIITQIVPESEMPRLEDGTVVDVILNPHGVISRMNLGQLLETHLGLKMKKKGESSITIKPFESFDIEGLKVQLRGLGFPEGKSMLYDANKKPITENPVTVGWQYIVKLNHIAQDKEHARSAGNYSSITQQAPRGKKNNGGQRIGEMEEWALLGHGAYRLLEEFASFKGDDVVSRREIMQNLSRFNFKVSNMFIPKRTVPESFRVFLMLLKGLGARPALVLNDGREVTDFDFLPTYELNNLSGLKVEIDDLTAPLKDAELIEDSGGAKVREYGELSCGCKGFFDELLYKQNPYICKKHTRVLLDCGCKGTLSEIAVLSDKDIICKRCDKKTNIKNVVVTLECGCDGVLSKSKKGKYHCSKHNIDIKEKANERIKVMWSEDREFYPPKGLFSNEIFTDDKKKGRREKIGYIELAEEMPYPLDESKKMRYLPVIPPGLRPMISNIYMGADLNYLYNQVIVHNNRLKYLLNQKQSKESTISEQHLDSARERLKKSIKGLMIEGAEINGRGYKSILDMLNGKEGLFRQAMLGKRIDFSARAVIVPAPQIRLDEVNLPLKIAKELFSPWLEDSLRKYEGMITEEIQYMLRAPIERIRKDRLINALNSFIKENNIVVVLNRAPSLHRYNLLAFKPIVKDQHVIGLHPLVCNGFNADFDGDQMAVYLPLIAQAEARELLDPYRHVFSIANGELMLHISQDIVAGLYLEGISKSQIREDIRKKYSELGPEAFIDYVQGIMLNGFKRATEKGLTISLFDFDPLMVSKEEREGILLRLTQAGYSHTNSLYTDWKKKVKETIEENVKRHKTNSVSILCMSGARGDMDTLTQLAGMRGMMASASSGDITEPVRSNFREGLSGLEFFISCHGSRSSLADKKLRVADAGDLTRHLIYSAMDLLITEDDCGSTEGITLQRRLQGRYALEDVQEAGVESGVLVTKEMAERLKTINRGLIVRSPVTCRTKNGICKKCYGIDLSTGKEPVRCLAVGVIAGESIGERGTQLSMRTFHTGGVKGSGQTVGLTRVKEIFERKERYQKISDLPINNYLGDLHEEYKNAIDDIHFEVILKAMLRGDGKGGYEIIGIKKAALSKADFLARTAFQRAKYEIKKAVLEGQYAPFDTIQAGLLLGGYFDSLLRRCGDV